MQQGLSSEKHFTVINNKASSFLRRLNLSRLEANMNSFLSPIERWPDNNYSPKELEYIWNQTPTTHKIITPLHGYKPQDVRIDISRGHLIILLSQDYGAVFISKEEYYCEIPIPADANQRKAYVEISPQFLIIRLDKKQSALKEAISVATNVKNYLALMFRIGVKSS